MHFNIVNYEMYNVILLVIDFARRSATFKFS